MFRHRRLSIALCGAVLLGALCVGLSCVPGPGTGTLKVLITDKPFPYEFLSEAIVYVQRVEVRMAGEDEDADVDEGSTDTAQDAPEDTEESDDGKGGPFIVIFESDEPGGKPFDLLELQNGRTDLLADADIPAGTYTQMRIVVTAGKVTLTDGTEFPLDVPSGSTSGIKLHFTFEVTDALETVLLLDVDLSRAFTPVPGGHIEDPSTISEFKFAPSLAMRLIEILDAGSISGVVTDSATGDPLADVSVTAYDADGAEVTSAATEADGTYMLGGLPAGTYSVEFSLAGYDDVVAADVVVEAGQTTADVNAAMAVTP